MRMIYRPAHNIEREREREMMMQDTGLAWLGERAV